MSTRETASVRNEAASRGDRTRAALVAAAGRFFREQGFERTTTGQVAREAGVAEGTVFLHYGSKVGLLVAVMREYYEALVADLDDVARGAGTPGERLRALVRFWIVRMARDWPLARVFGQFGRYAGETEVAAQFHDMNRQVTRIFGGVVEDLKSLGEIRREVPTRVLRDMVFGTAEHLILGALHTGRDLDFEAAADHLVDVLRQGAAPAPAAAGGSLASIEAKLDTVLTLVGRGARADATRKRRKG